MDQMGDILLLTRGDKPNCPIIREWVGTLNGIQNAQMAFAFILACVPLRTAAGSG